MRGVLAQIRAEIDRLKAEPLSAGDGAEAARFAWYAEGCPCGLEPGQCREHPRARPSQRPPAGDWRTWLLLMGRGAGKTRRPPSGSGTGSRPGRPAGSPWWGPRRPTSAT